MKNKWIAFVFSFLLPGAGQFYLGERIKALTLFSITAGLAFAFLMNHSWINLLFLGPLWIFVMVPAAMDAFQTASGKPRTFTGESMPYVIFMLLAVGPFAIPLLWQSPKFSKTAKIVWTVLVILIAVGVIFLVNQTATLMDDYLKQPVDSR